MSSSVGMMKLPRLIAIDLLFSDILDFRATNPLCYPECFPHLSRPICPATESPGEGHQVSPVAFGREDATHGPLLQGRREAAQPPRHQVLHGRASFAGQVTRVSAEPKRDGWAKCGSNCQRGCLHGKSQLSFGFIWEQLWIMDSMKR